MKILTVFDIHLSDQTPGYQTEGYVGRIFAKLWETVEIAKREGATHVFWAGDVFDNKSATKTHHRTLQGVAEVLAAYGLPVYVVVGNHDLAAGGNLESIAKQPIGMLRFLPNVTLMEWEPVRLDNEVVVYPVPGVSIRQEEDWVQRYVTGSKTKRTIILAHQLIARDLSKYPAQAQDAMQSSDEIAQVTDASLIISGDLHSYQGVYTKPNGRGGHVGFANLGALCRLSVKDVDHKPQVLLLTIEDDARRSLKFQEIPLTSVRPASEVYRLEEYYEAKDHQADIDETIRRINTGTIHKFSIDALAEEIKTNESVTPPVRDKAIELIESVR